MATLGVPTILGSLQRATNTYEQRLDERLIELGLTSRELQVMRSAFIEDATIAQVRAATGMHPSTLSSLVARLIRAGYLRKRRGGPDGRHRVIELTIPGAEAARIAEDILFELEAAIQRETDDRGGLDALTSVVDAISRLPIASTDPADGLPETTA